MVKADYLFDLCNSCLNNLSKCGILMAMLPVMAMEFTIPSGLSKYGDYVNDQRSFSQPILLFLLIPISLIGVAWGHWIHDFPVNILSLLGIIALIGISSRNSLLLIDFTRSLMHEKGMHKAEAIAYSSATRAKPIFLTAVAIMLASTLLAGDAVFGGLGVSLIFGTIAAVIASLIVVPVLLYMTDLEKQFHFHERKAVSIEDPL